MEARKLSPVGYLARRPLLRRLAASLDRLRQLNHKAEDYLDQLHQPLNQEDCLDLQQPLHSPNLEVFLGLLSLLKVEGYLALLQLQHKHSREVYLDLHNLHRVVGCLGIQILRSQLRRVDYLGPHNLHRAEDHSVIIILHNQPKQVDCLARRIQHHNLSKVAACSQGLQVNKINQLAAYLVGRLLHSLLKAVCSII